MSDPKDAPEAEIDAAERARRLRVLVALEIHRIVQQVRTRRDFLITVWSRHRRRDAFRDTLFTRWRTLHAGELIRLDSQALAQVGVFYDALEAFQMYLEYTEDMPTMLGDTYDRYAVRLAERAAPALEALGGLPEALRPALEPVPELGPPPVPGGRPDDAFPVEE